ncbi:M15 family metallopeptidase [Phytoactinopolyspora halophila]|uniref:M15 family metallopeptidase n=1 Tax=Phytoactinopolyspora halophila TaxID=1981511 RepID=UPI0013148FA7|nr:M15 family metallopeptidase [Phytoactinopolyspora halophila]
MASLQSAEVSGPPTAGEQHGREASQDLQALSELRDEAAGDTSRNSQRSPDPPDGRRAADSEEPGQAEATVTPPTPTPSGEDDGSDEEADNPEDAAGPAATGAESDLSGGFPPPSDCDATVPAEGDVANGRLTSEHLCDVGEGHELRPDAAAAFAALAEAYADATGESLLACVGNAYRSYDQQVDLYAEKPNLAARPGTSQHGWGLAVDFECGANSYSSAFYDWLATAGGEYGWHNPSWAQPEGSRPEPWHWEFDPSLIG